MLAFPSMISGPAIEAGMRVPPDDVIDDYESDAYPHFAVYCTLHLGQPLDWGSLQERLAHNAKMIAAIPDDKIRETTFRDLRKLGWWE